jgi:hypothetical protein
MGELKETIPLLGLYEFLYVPVTGMIQPPVTWLVGIVLGSMWLTLWKTLDSPYPKRYSGVMEKELCQTGIQ